MVDSIKMLVFDFVNDIPIVGSILKSLLLMNDDDARTGMFSSQLMVKPPVKQKRYVNQAISVYAYPFMLCNKNYNASKA